MTLTDRIMLAVVEALEDEDPVVQIGVRQNGLVLSWPAERLADVLPFTGSGKS